MPQVREVFAQGWISKMYMEYREFEACLTESLESQSCNERPSDRDFGYFGDAIKECSHWYGFFTAYLRGKERREHQLRARE